MKIQWVINGALFAICLSIISISTRSKVISANESLKTGVPPETKVKAPTASWKESQYCTQELKDILRRVLTNCGLIGGGRAGCQPSEVKNFAKIEGSDFNALFTPLSKRGGVILFDVGKEDLDNEGKALLERLWSDPRGAQYFFVVARASTDGPTVKNRILSQKRANSVMLFLQDRFGKIDPDIEKKVGLMWLGEEYAQLGKEFCTWQRNRQNIECKEEIINRSAVVSWIDCSL